MGSVAGRQCHIMVDTGSNITLVRPDVLAQPGSVVNIQPVNNRLRTVTGETAPIHGICDSDITIGGCRRPHKLWVADITDECILGLDFLQQHQSLIDLNAGMIHIGEEDIPLQCTSRSEELVCHRCFANMSLSIPPWSEVLIPAAINNLKKSHDRLFLLEPENISLTRSGLLVKKTLVMFSTKKSQYKLST